MGKNSQMPLEKTTFNHTMLKNFGHHHIQGFSISFFIKFKDIFRIKEFPGGSGQTVGNG